MTYATNTKLWGLEVPRNLKFPAWKFVTDCTLNLQVWPGIHIIRRCACLLHFSTWLSLHVMMMHTAYLGTVSEITIIITIIVTLLLYTLVLSPAVDPHRYTFPNLRYFFRNRLDFTQSASNNQQFIVSIIRLGYLCPWSLRVLFGLPV